ncbi:MAG: hypothetical protein ACLGHJ_10280 [Gammaproteobacteria bacterium]
MNKRFLPVVSLLSLLLLAEVAVAAGGKTQQQFYRYKNAQGNVVIERSIPPEYVSKGYQIVTASGQVIQDVPPADTIDPETARRNSEDAAKNVKLDVQLRKLYSSPMDAVNLRTRKLNALNDKLDIARGQVSQLTNRRKAELDSAARMERSGKKVPEQIRANIESYDRRIADQQAQIADLEADQQALREEFAIAISRLNVIYPDKAVPESMINPPAPAPAAPAAPAAAPAAPAKPAAAPAKAAPAK